MYHKKLGKMFLIATVLCSIILGSTSAFAQSVSYKVLEKNCNINYEESEHNKRLNSNLCKQNIRTTARAGDRSVERIINTLERKYGEDQQESTIKYLKVQVEKLQTLMQKNNTAKRHFAIEYLHFKLVSHIEFLNETSAENYDDLLTDTVNNTSNNRLQYKESGNIRYYTATIDSDTVATFQMPIDWKYTLLDLNNPSLGYSSWYSPKVIKPYTGYLSILGNIKMVFLGEPGNFQGEGPSEMFAVLDINQSQATPQGIKKAIKKLFYGADYENCEVVEFPVSMEDNGSETINTMYDQTNKYFLYMIGGNQTNPNTGCSQYSEIRYYNTIGKLLIIVKRVPHSHDQIPTSFFDTLQLQKKGIIQTNSTSSVNEVSTINSIFVSPGNYIDRGCRLENQRSLLYGTPNCSNEFTMITAGKQNGGITFTYTGAGLGMEISLVMKSQFDNSHNDPLYIPRYIARLDGSSGTFDWDGKNICVLNTNNGETLGCNYGIGDQTYYIIARKKLANGSYFQVKKDDYIKTYISNNLIITNITDWGTIINAPWKVEQGIGSLQI